MFKIFQENIHSFVGAKKVSYFMFFSRGKLGNTNCLFRPEVIKLMLNSAEHKIYPAHK